MSRLNPFRMKGFFGFYIVAVGVCDDPFEFDTEGEIYVSKRKFKKHRHYRSC